MSGRSRARHELERVAALWPLPVLAAGVAMLAWGWLRWPDPLIDFGRELYVPWRLVEGDVLYADLAYFNGPLSPSLNALWFRLFGVGLHTLAACNIALAGVLGAVLLSELARLADRWAACAAGVVFVCVFAFVQIDTVGNYNYVTPYSHEVTHGMLLGALAVLASLRGSQRPRLSAAAAGGLLGLCFLTKAEPFVAAAGAVVLAQGLAVAAAPRPLAETLRRGGPLVAGLLLPPALATLLLARQLPVDDAFRGVLGSWAYVFDPRLTSLRFYRWGVGTLELASNLTSLAGFTVAGLALFATSAAVALRARTRCARRVGAALLACVAAAAVLGSPYEVPRLVRPLPVVLPALGLVFGVRWWRAAGDPAARADEAARLAWTVWALLLLAKIFLNVSLTHYGFALAMPGTLILIATLVSALPRAVAARGGSAAVVRATGLAVVAASLVVVLGVVAERFGREARALGGPEDRFLAGRRGEALQRALEAIDLYVAPGETLAVLPEGVMLNYLSRRVNPTGQLNFMPPELIMFGEASMLAAFRERPPDFVLLVHKSTREYGFAFFGRDYGQALYRWVEAAYHPLWQLGAVPLQGPHFGIQLLERDDRRPFRGMAPADRGEGEVGTDPSTSAGVH